MQEIPDYPDYPERSASPNHPGPASDVLTGPLSGPLEPPRLAADSPLAPVVAVWNTAHSGFPRSVLPGPVPGDGPSPEKIASVLRHPSRSLVEMVDGAGEPAVYAVGSLWQDSEGDLWVADEAGYLIFLTVGQTAPKWGPMLMVPQVPEDVVREFGALEPVAGMPSEALAALHKAQRRIQQLQEFAARPRGAVNAQLSQQLERSSAVLGLTVRELAQAREDLAQAREDLAERTQQLQGFATSGNREALVTAAADVADEGSALVQLSHQVDALTRENKGHVSMLAQAQEQLRTQVREIQRLTGALEVARGERDAAHTEWLRREQELIALRAAVEYANTAACPPERYEPLPWDRWDLPGDGTINVATRNQYAHSVLVFGPPPRDDQAAVAAPAPDSTGGE